MVSIVSVRIAESREERQPSQFELECLPEAAYLGAFRSAQALGSAAGEVEWIKAEEQSGSKQRNRPATARKNITAAGTAAEKYLSPVLRELIDPARGISAGDVFDAALFAQRMA
jgi:hypothetical protein